MKLGEIQKILILRGLGFNQREIAEELQVSQVTISNRLKALKKIAQKEGPLEAFKKVMEGVCKCH